MMFGMESMWGVPADMLPPAEYRLLGHLVEVLEKVLCITIGLSSVT